MARTHVTGTEGYDDFYRDDHHAVVLFLLSLGASHQEALDVTQDAMIVMFRKWPVASPRGYVRVVAKRLLWKHWERANRERPHAELPEATRDQGAVPRGQVEFSAEVQYVLSLLSALPSRQRMVMAYTIDGFSTDEIADLTGLSEPTVRSHLRHARNKLNELIRTQGGGFDDGP